MPRPSVMLRRLVLVGWALWSHALLPAQDGETSAQDHDRPRIGLVLSGGGARGAAHAGVLAALEQLRIPISCVVGTSMGAIMGGLYAYGHSPQELERLLTREGSDHDWDYMLSDGDGRPALAFRRKEETQILTGRIKLGVQGFSLRLPKGWIQGQNLETELRFLTSEAHDLRSFDELPLPFRCVASDIGSGREVVLDHGNLAMALRASMSLPGLFAPAVIDGRELLDGGLVDNLPVDVALDLGCDALIVVDIGSPLASADTLKDLLDVSSQMLGILTQQNVERSLALMRSQDVLIHPDLGDITLLDFERARDSIRIGAEATLAKSAQLQRYSLDEAAYARYLQHQRRIPSPPPRIRNIIVDNHSGISDAVIEAKLGVQPGRVVDEQTLRAGIAHLYGTDDLQRIGFEWRNRAGDAADLVLSVEDKSWGVDTLQVGLRLESNFNDASSFELGVLYTMKHLNSLGAEWRTLLGIGSESVALTEFYQPLFEDGSFFVAPNVAAAQLATDVYFGSTKFAEGKLKYYTGGVDLGANLGAVGELRVGLIRTRGTADIDLSILPFPIPDIQFDDGLAHALLRFDTFDDGFFPRRGFRSSIEYRLGSTDLGGDADYQTLSLSHAQAFSYRDLTAVVSADFDTSVAGSRPAYARPSLGGFLRLSGLPPSSISGQYMSLGTLMLRQQVSEGLAPLFVGTSIEYGNVWQNRDDEFEHWILSGSLFVAVDSPVGPVHVGVGVVEGNEYTGFLFLGPTR